MDLLALITPRLIAECFAPRAVERGGAYADEGAVSEVRVEADERFVQISALVHGSRGGGYLLTLELDVGPGGRPSLSSSCTCPMAYDCKHGAALAFVVHRAVSGAATGGAPGRGAHEELDALLDDLSDLAPPDQTPPSVALELSLVANRYEHTHLRLRPLRPGARQNWVKTGLGWTDVPRARMSQTYDVAQLDVLARLQTALGTTGGSYLYASDIPSLDRFGPALVPLLHDAVAAGITLVTLPPLVSWRPVAEPARLRVDARSTPEATEIRVLLDVDGRRRGGDDVVVFGDPVHTAAVVDDGHVLLAAVVPRLPPGATRALTRSRPVTVPTDADDGSAEALADRLGRLTRLLPVDSADGTVAVPVALAPFLRVSVTWSGTDDGSGPQRSDGTRADVVWEFVYGAVGVAIDATDEITDGPTQGVTAPGPVLRDRLAERALLAAVVPPPPVGRATLDGVDALHLALLELPAWRELAERGLVEVVEHHAPTFREAEEAPEFRFEVPADDEPSGQPGDQHTDWLDLDVVITVEGEQVLLAVVLEALTLGEEYLVLPSGLYLRTDRPEFARLAEIVRAAGELRDRDDDRDDGRVRIARDDLGLWAELGDLGAMDAQAGEWVRRAQALRDLTELPTPDPVGVESTLRAYQLDGFRWLAFLHQHGLGGILADDMGLGKTLQVLSLVAHVRAREAALTGDPGERVEPVAPRPFLVVAPTSVVSAWVSEAARHTPGLRVRTVPSSGARRGATVAAIASGADVVVTTYTLLRLEQDAYAALSWEGLILDEAHHVKNHRSKAYAAVRMISADFRLAVTGTPFENRLMELWSLLSIVAPGLYPRPQNFLDHVVRPVEKEGDARALARFSRRIRPFLLRRTKDLVAADLPAKQEQVLEVELGPAHRKLYDTHLNKERQRILGLLEDFSENRVAVLAALTKLRQLALDPSLVDPGLDRVPAAKLDVLVEHLLELAAEGHRALVFSSFTGFLAKVRGRLEAAGLDYAYLDGSTTGRGEVVEGFRTGTAPVFLISLKAGGTGLTLTEADYVFILDPWWNPAAEAQAVDRAHRIGQERTVMVYRLVSAGTIEDKVMSLKARKARLFAQVVDGQAGLSAQITADDLRDLFD